MSHEGSSQQEKQIAKANHPDPALLRHEKRQEEYWHGAPAAAATMATSPNLNKVFSANLGRGGRLGAWMVACGLAVRAVGSREQGRRRIDDPSTATTKVGSQV
jgi:hypothetical protein